jgi:hypothetical protein
MNLLSGIKQFKLNRYPFWQSRLQLVCVRVLALCVRATAGGTSRPTLIEFPPMQKGASFNMAAVKEQLRKAAASHPGE